MTYNFNTKQSLSSLGIPENLIQIRDKINQNYLIPETEIIPQLLQEINISESVQHYINKHATQIILHAKSYKKINLVQQLMQEFSLSSTEGLSLMCLAESLLRIPDQSTRIALIRDKIKQGNWSTHLDNTGITLMYASAMGLNIAKKILSNPQTETSTISKTVHKVVSQFGEPIIHKSVDVAMHLMGEQFVIGEDISKALKNSITKKNAKILYSYDMLGEAALTANDSNNYFNAYANAIHEIGKHAQASSSHLYENNGISIKLSALHPRYSYAQKNRVVHELYEKLLNLVNLAKEYNIGINIDAEECERLDISLDLFTMLCKENSLAGWNGLGFVVQAYQKRAYYVLDYLINLAKHTKHKFMIRLVKGAYWDSEVKYAQQESLSDYPVFTRKYHTDINYITCAEKILNNCEHIYPQFATHNALTIATVLNLIRDKNYNSPYEFQCLYGMGEQIYAGVQKEFQDVQYRIYAPVGTHTTLLPYLVRRLLENGANSSFVNQLGLDKNFSEDKTEDKFNIEKLLENPIQKAKADSIVGQPHLNIPNPHQLFKDRKNSKGINIANNKDRLDLEEGLNKIFNHKYDIKPMLHNFKNDNNIITNSNLDDDKNDDGLDKLNDTIINRNINQNNLINNNHNIKPVLNPNNVNDVIGSIEFSDITQVEHACEQAHLNYENWAVNSNQKRAEILLKAAEMFEEVEYQNHLINLLMREAGKTLKNSIAEIREAVDFLRYYAKQILDYQSQIHNMQPLGAVTCISPWNFPLAIFIGQISAALVCGNSVIAKPAEQTSLIAGFAVDIMHKAGVPTYALQLLIGLGETIGDAMVKNPHVQAVIFTGSLNVAKIIQSNLSSRLNQHGQPIVLIAETGGQNAMIVDSSALPQQVVQDIIQSSFDSAGQRCSALRVLCIQEDIYEHTTELIQQAMEELNIGNSININCDVNAVIDRDSLLNIQTYIKTLKSSHIIYQPNSNSQKQSSISNNGYFCPPTLIYINSLDVLQNEVFGPVLHIMKYKREDLAELVNNINHLGYGLTMGVHSRIEDSIQTVLKNSHVGNVYVNRNMVGAIVGVQPFGGDNLSGTGPKAGGGLYLLKLLQNKQECNYIIYKYLKQMQEDEDNSIRLESVTGEVNEYSLSIKKHILCIADKALDLKKQIDLVFNMGASPIILEVHKNRIHGISDVDSKLITTAHNIEKIQNLDAILYAGKDSISIMQIIAKSYQKIIPIITLNEDNSYSLVSLFNEKSVSINTTASGGNASLMSL